MNDLHIPAEQALKEKEHTYILIFKTNIRFKKDIKIIAPLLDKHPSVFKWNIDRTDIDKVLRIESEKNNTTEIIYKIRQAGYRCEELPG